jgi:hypothetical protein
VDYECTIISNTISVIVLIVQACPEVQVEERVLNVEHLDQELPLYGKELQNELKVCALSLTL